MPKVNSAISIQVVWETGIPVWASKLWRPKKLFSSFLLSVIFQQKNTLEW